MGNIKGLSVSVFGDANTIFSEESRATQSPYHRMTQKSTPCEPLPALHLRASTNKREKHEKNLDSVPHFMR